MLTQPGADAAFGPEVYDKAHAVPLEQLPPWLTTIFTNAVPAGISNRRFNTDEVGIFVGAPGQLEAFEPNVV